MYLNLVIDYIIEYKTVKAKSWTKVITVSGSVYEHCIENIKEKDELIFRISAENAIGVSLAAESQTVKLEKHASKYLNNITTLFKCCYYLNNHFTISLIIPTQMYTCL